jgi:hypothetical protein
MVEIATIATAFCGRLKLERRVGMGILRKKASVMYSETPNAM